MRLNVFIARTGICSRRKADILISEGKIKINGQLLTQLGVKIDPNKDVVTYRGRILRLKEKNTYILLYKPKGYITTTKDERGRKIVLDLLSPELKKKRLFPVGRLDKDTTGLLILTDDGEFANRLMHPGSSIEKTYRVILDKPFQRNDGTKLIKGIKDEGELLKAKSIKQKAKKEVEIILTEGKKREIKRMFKKIGYKVIEIVRTRYAFLTLKGLKEGEYSNLTQKEIGQLRSS